MRGTKKLRDALRALLLACLLVSRAAAQPAADAGAGAPSPPPAQPPDAAPPSAPTDPNAVTPPRLLAFVDAGYPEAARASGMEPAVLLLITIGEDGFVEDATLAGEPVGYGFDELAQAAARRFVFEPATRGGEPMRSRIQYRYEFKYVPETEAARAPPEARLSVTLRDADDDDAVAEAELIVSTPENPEFALRLVTDAAGRAEATGLREGSYEIAITHPRFAAERHTEQLTAGETTELTYRLAPARSYEEYGAVARVKAPAREVTRRTIEREELTRVAGTRGDALRTIELLPGVSRPPFGSGQVLIRGSAPGDTQVLLDGVPVPLLYHFGGITSFINSRALERIDFYPGNFSARYGRRTGGIIDVGVRDPATDGYHGLIDTNLPLDTSLLLEGPITDKASFLVAGRRSYLGEVLTATLPEDEVGALTAPVYYDYQGFVSYRPTDRDRLRFGVYGASDRLDVLFADNDDDPAVEGIEVGQQFHRAQIGWRRQYTTRLEHDMQVSYAREDNVVRLPPDFDLDLSINNFYVRAEWRYRLRRTVQLIAGTDSALGNYSVSYRGPSLPDQEASGAGASFGALPLQTYARRGTSFDVAGYLEVALTPVRPLRIVPGMRVDYSQLIDRFSFDPRLSVIYSVREGTRLKAGVGVFSQPPDAPQALPAFGNPDLYYVKALHYGAGVEHDFREDLSLNLEGFYKDIYDRVVNTDARAAAARGVLDPPPFENDGIGRVYGLEVSGRKLPRGRWFGFLSYTLMRSERKDHDEPWRLFNYDQTHILSAAATVRLGRGWELGGTVRIVSGNPRTPIIGASFDQDIGAYTAENGAPNSRRSRTFHRLDVRFEKIWRFDRFRLALYLDVQNAYNAKNPEGVAYNFNYKERSEIRGIPLLPILGVRGEL